MKPRVCRHGNQPESTRAPVGDWPGCPVQGDSLPAQGREFFVLQREPLPLDIRIEKHETAVVLSISGQIDLYNDQSLSSELFGLFDEGHRRLVLDMGGVPFVDSAGFGVLIAAQKRFRASGGQIHYTNVPKNVESVIKLSRLQDFITVYASRAEAMTAFTRCDGSA